MKTCKYCHRDGLCTKQAIAVIDGTTILDCEDFVEGYDADLAHRWCNSKVGDQHAKADEGKLQLTLVPLQIIEDIAEVRMYGNKKYHDPDNWMTVEPERYRDAAFRHFLAYLREPWGKDEESGISHLAHLACNIAFLCEFEAGNVPFTKG